MTRTTVESRPVAAKARRRAEVFSEAIDAALADGGKRQDLVLRLTLSDSAELKRDPLLPVADISFAGGKMSFLGVEVLSGGVTTSRLGVRGDEPEPAPAPPVKKATRKKAAPKAAVAKAAVAKA